MPMSPTLRGALMLIAGGAILGLIDNFVRIIADYSGLWQFHFLRSFVALPLLVVVARLQGMSMLPMSWARVMGRTAFMASSMLLYFAALPLLPIAQVAAGLFTAPIWVLVFSALLFGQRIGPIRVAAVALGALGVLLILRPEEASFSVISLVPLLAGALYAMCTITTYRWCATESTMALLMANFGTMGVLGALGVLALALVPVPPAWVEAAPFVVGGWQGPETQLWFWILVQATGSILALFLIFRAYQSADTSYLTVFEYGFLIFAGIWGWILWGQPLGPRELSGMALIIVAGTIIARARS